MVIDIFHLFSISGLLLSFEHIIILPIALLCPIYKWSHKQRNSAYLFWHFPWVQIPAFLYFIFHLITVSSYYICESICLQDTVSLQFILVLKWHFAAAIGVLITIHILLRLILLLCFFSLHADIVSILQSFLNGNHLCMTILKESLLLQPQHAVTHQT